MELLDGDAEFSTQKYKNFKNVLDSEIQMISWLDFSNSKLVRDAYFPGCMCILCECTVPFLIFNVSFLEFSYLVVWYSGVS